MGKGSIVSKIYRPEGKMQTGLDDLIAMIPETQRGLCVEVGSAAGESTEHFAKVFEIVVCVDPWPGNMDRYFELFKTRMKPYPHVFWYREPSLVGAQYIKDASADLVYIDAIHDTPHPDNDIGAWLPKVKQGGWIGGHDYKRGKFDGVVSAVHKHFPNHFVYQFADNSWLVKV
jgi:hypothetical protein